MALTYFKQPFTATVVNRNKERHGEVGKYGEFYIQDANQNIAAYVRICPGLGSTVGGRYTEAQTIANTIVTQLNLL